MVLVSTHCRIGIVNPDNTVRFTYCHFDGYLSHVGWILFFHYNTSKDINELLDLGFISGLEPTLEKTHFYIRDYDEDVESNEADTTDSPEAFWSMCWLHTEIGYLFENNKWYYRSRKAAQSEDLEVALEKSKGYYN